MTKKWIIILIIAISLAMIGLILVQSIWIKQAYELKEMHFGQLVNNSVLRVTKSMQEKEVASNVLNSLDYLDSTEGSPQGDKSSRYLVDTFAQVPKANSETPAPQFNNPQENQEGYWITEQHYQYSIDKEGNQSIEQNFEVRQKILNQISKDKGHKKKFVDNILKKLDKANQNIEQRIKKEDLFRTISGELSDAGIYLPYEYGVVDAQKNALIKSKGFEFNNGFKYYSARLFPEDFISKPYYLVIYFPGQKNYIFRLISYMGTSSLLLTFFILVVFGATIFVIIRQKRLSEIRNDFVNNMTHELKTPISTISLASQMLSDKSIPIESKNLTNLAGVISDETKRLSFQVEKVLQMAVFDKGKISLKIRQLDIHELVNNVVKNFIIQVRNRNGQIVKNLDAEFSLVNVDEVHFSNVLLNLLDNAIKYSKGQPHIEVSTFNKRNGIVIRVKDNGIGISKANQKRIFERFFRVSTGNVHNVKGFGLGLSYVKKIVEEMGGKISLESEINVGTKFDIWVPVIK
ncbi:MAG TPA: HAMP domain-containing sensor histidine kinase [Bacteroidales bacterium]|nr:HAMP domain-containing sensor histidine kinase [Bacteroidales bacterium]